MMRLLQRLEGQWGKIDWNQIHSNRGRSAIRREGFDLQKRASVRMDLKKEDFRQSRLIM